MFVKEEWDQKSDLLNFALKKNMISFWELEEVSGKRVDAHGTNDLTDNNTVTQTTGKVNFAGQFTRANLEYLSLPSANTTLRLSSDFSWCAWVYLDSLPGGSELYNVIDRAQNYSLDVPGTTLVFRFYYIDSGAIVRSRNATTFGTPAINTWYFIYFDYTFSTMTSRISVNNGVLDSSTFSTSPNVVAAEFRLGDRANVRHWNGRIDQVGVWSRVLTESEIEWLYNKGNGRAYEDIF
jgi:hypothetical protein